MRSEDTPAHRGPNPCPLCLGGSTSLVHRDAARPYWQCAACDLVFVPPSQHVSPAAEKRRYDQHQNRNDDPGYRNFLRRLIDPLAPRLTPGAEGLDFGSGPGPVLSQMLVEQGFRMATYDPYYADRPAVLTRTYDFVTCSETVEHFRCPAEEWTRLFRLVRPGGWLGVMTLFRDSATDFGRWWYINDETHIAFYSRQTLAWLARRHNGQADIVGPSVVLFKC